jgi:hypothetical protein
VTPLSLGIEVKGGIFERLIDKNTTIPTEESKIFTTAADNQTSVNIRVFQGEREIADENELLGAFQLTGIPPAPAGTPQIEVTFNIDENGIVNVEAEDKGSGNSEDITIEGGVGLSDEEIEQMQEEAEEHAEEDQKRREFVEARNDAEASVQRAETLLEENEDQVDDEIREDIEVEIEAVEEALEEYAEVDSDELDEATEALESTTESLPEALQEIGKQMYEGAAPARGRPAPVRRAPPAPVPAPRARVLRAARPAPVRGRPAPVPAARTSPSTSTPTSRTPRRRARATTDRPRRLGARLPSFSVFAIRSLGIRDPAQSRLRTVRESHLGEECP